MRCRCLVWWKGDFWRSCGNGDLRECGRYGNEDLVWFGLEGTVCTSDDELRRTKCGVCCLSNATS